MPFISSRGMLRGALEVHVLDPVGRAGPARRLVAGAHAVPAPDRHERSRMNRTDQNFQPIVEARLADGGHRRLLRW